MIPQVPDDGSRDDPLESLIPVGGWIAYHGTSSAYVSSIESLGLSADYAPWTPAECRAVCAVYEKLHWFGTSLAFGVLSVWGPDRDIAVSGRRHVYLTETFARATAYARPPGGEILCALVSCIEELDRYQNDRDLREKHLTRLAADLGSSGYVPDRAGKVKRKSSELPLDVQKKVDAMQSSMDLGWLKNEITNLQLLRERLTEIQRGHRPVVYAVVVDRGLLEGAYFSTAMGLEITQSIPPDRLVGKASPISERDQTVRSGDDFESRLALWNLWHQRVDQVNGPTDERDRRM